MISVIIPNYNNANYVSDSIESVVNQSFIDWELIVVDDLSTDNSWDVIQTYVIKFDNISSFKNYSNKKGGSVCRNIGLEKSKGSYVLFLDSDDVLSNFCLKNRFEAIDIKENLDFYVNPMATFYNEIGDSNFIWNQFEGNHLIRFLSHNLPWQTMMVLWKKDALINLNGFDVDFCRLQDVELHTRALLFNLKYKINSSFPADCYYRIDEKRFSIDYSSYLENKIDGSIIYIYKFLDLLDNLNKKQMSKYLKGTFFVILSEICLAFVLKKIDESEKNFLIEDFLKKSSTLIYSKKDNLLVSIYLFLNKFKLRIKGVNYLFKMLIIS
jgi:glycosyltransferase involved in cell wall biosynthesis